MGRVKRAWPTGKARPSSSTSLPRGALPASPRCRCSSAPPTITPAGWSSSGWTARILYRLLQGDGMPVTAFISRKGAVARVYSGELDEALLRQLTDQLLQT